MFADASLRICLSNADDVSASYFAENIARQLREPLQIESEVYVGKIKQTYKNGLHDITGYNAIASHSPFRAYHDGRDDNPVIYLDLNGISEIKRLHLDRPFKKP